MIEDTAAEVSVHAEVENTALSQDRLGVLFHGLSTAATEMNLTTGGRRVQASRLKTSRRGLTSHSKLARRMTTVVMKCRDTQYDLSRDRGADI